ncbi:MAG: TonB-dependent receptor, partial [Myxococcota bacterium]
VITKSPNLSEPEGWAAVELGNFDHKKVSLSYSVPIIEEELAFRGSASWMDRDGFYEDIHNGRNEYNNRDRYTLRGQLAWAPSDTFDARFIGEYSQKDESCCPAQVYIAGPTSNRIAPAAPGIDELAALMGLGLDVPNIDCTVPADCTAGTYNFVKRSKSDLEKRKVGFNYEPFEKTDEYGLSLEMNFDFDWAKAKSITAFRRYTADYAQDIDYTSADILRPQQGAEDDFKNFSEELQFQGTAFDHLDWLVGTYIYTEDVSTRERLEFGSQAAEFVYGLASPALGSIPEGGGYSAHWTTESTGYAIFTNNTWSDLVFEGFDITVGARWSREKKDAEGIINDAPLAVVNGNFTGNYVAGQPVPFGTNDLVQGLVPGGVGWCEDLSAVPGLGGVRNVLRGFCDNASWKNTATEKEWTYTASLTYRWTEDFTTYYTYSRGYKTGGFNLDQESVDLFVNSTTGVIDPTNGLCPTLCDGGTAINDESRFAPEFANAHEIGVKGTFLDGRVRTNIAGFYTTFDDFQLNTFNGLGFTVSNVDKVEARGFELESFIELMEGLNVTLGTTYANATYGKNIPDFFLHNNPNGSASTQFFAAGERITNAPLWTSTIGIQGQHALPGTEWLGRASTNVSYRGDHNSGSNLHPLKAVNSYWLMNMEVGVVSPDEHWELSFWVNNLTDEYVNQIVFDSVFQAGSYSTFFNAPRMWGGTLKYIFN